jgi:hypothetical protein
MKCAYHPEKTIEAIGMHHCPNCGMMVQAGTRHPLLIEFIDEDDRPQGVNEMLGIDQGSGWYCFYPDFMVSGPHPTYDEAVDHFSGHMKLIYGYVPETVTW